MEDKTKRRYINQLNINFPHDPKLKSTLESFLEIDNITFSELEKIFSLVQNCNLKLLSYGFDTIALNSERREVYDSLNLFKQEVIEGKIGYLELKKYI